MVQNSPTYLSPGSAPARDYNNITMVASLALLYTN